MSYRESERFLINCENIPEKTVSVLSTTFKQVEIYGTEPEHDFTTLKFTMDFPIGTLAVSRVNYHLENDGEVTLRVATPNKQNELNEFTVTSIRNIDPKEETDKEIAEVVINVPKQQLDIFFPKTTTDEWSIFESWLLISNN